MPDGSGLSVHSCSLAARMGLLTSLRMELEFLSTTTVSFASSVSLGWSNFPWPVCPLCGHVAWEEHLKPMLLQKLQAMFLFFLGFNHFVGNINSQDKFRTYWGCATRKEPEGSPWQQPHHWLLYQPAPPSGPVGGYWKKPISYSNFSRASLAHSQMLLPVVGCRIL